jgi:hypothetical protein
VILSAHHFGCHIAWSARRVLAILSLPYFSDTEVSYTDVPALLYNEIFRFNISMNNSLIMHIF